MDFGRAVVIAVILLQAGAAITYGWRGDWRHAMIWGGVMVSNLGILLVSP